MTITRLFCLENLFGVESNVYISINVNEKNKFDTLLNWFLFLSIASLFACVFLMYMIFSSFIMALFGGISLSLIVSNIIRFSLLSIQKPIKAENSKNKDIEEDETIEVDKEIAADKETSKKEKIIKKLNSFRALFPVFFIRVIINFIMLLLLVFPLSCLIQLNKLDQINDEKRSYYVQEFIGSNKKLINEQTRKLNQQILQLETDLKKYEETTAQNVLYLSKKNDLERAIQNRDVYINDSENDLKKNTNELRNDLSEKYFIINCFNYIAKTPLFSVLFFIFLCVFIYCHIIMYQIRNNTKEGYAAKATSFYIDIVAKDYAELKRKMDDIVHTKFRHLNYNYEEKMRWADPPFNTIEKTVFTEKQAVNKKEAKSILNV
jgi:hypothetical protein